MSVLAVGIDPGLDGAIAAVDGGGDPRIWDMPTLLKGGKTKSGKPSGKRAIDLGALSKILLEIHAAKLCHVELVHAMPGQGVSSMFSMGRGLGVLEGMLTAYQVPFELVSPQRWKGAVLADRPKDKQATILWAKSRYPRAALTSPGCRVPSDGRADALALAHHAYFTGTSGFPTPQP